MQYESSGYTYFGGQVAEEDNSSGFIIELVDGKSSTNCTVFVEHFTLSLSLIL